MKTLKEVNIEQVWNHFLQNHDTASRDILWEYYLPQVKYTAEHLHARFPQSVELEDLYSAGIEGLLDAIYKFNPAKNTKFETYCVLRIKGAIYDDLRKNDKVPRLVRARAKQLEEVTQRLEAIFGRRPYDEELADELDLDMEEFYNFQRDANASSFISLDTTFSESDENNEFGELSILTNQKSKDPFHEILKKDLRIESFTDEWLNYCTVQESVRNSSLFVGTLKLAGRQNNHCRPRYNFNPMLLMPPLPPTALIAKDH